MIGWYVIFLLGVLCVPLTMAFNSTTTPLPIGNVFIVDDTGDAEDADPTDGVCATETESCTLRAAIQQANALAAATDLLMDIISFSIPGNGPHRIQPASPLPPITAPILIDGTTQPGFDMDTLSIELEGSRAGGEANGLTILAGNSAIQGLMINNFGVNGVFIDNSHNNMVGTPEAGNIISGNVLDGILISGTSTMNQILDNVIDTNMNGVAIPDEGVANTIQANSIFGNLLNGVLISGTSTMNEIFENSISDNLLNGVLISGTSTANSIFGNSIFVNANLGIDLGDDGVTPNDLGDADSGANNLQNAPEIFSAITETENTTITGSLNSTPTTEFVIEFFANTDFNASGFGEGETLIGAIVTETDNLGDATFDFVPLDAQSPGVFITATATEPSGNTSEFSSCVATE